MKRVLTAILLAVFVVGGAFGAAPHYDTGNQYFSIKAGVTFPTFIYFFADKEVHAGLGEGGTGAKAGGYGGISYQIFNTPYTAIGGEIGYNFNFAVSEELFTAVPFYAKYTYFPVQGMVDLPISVGLGGAYTKFADASLMTLYVNTEIGVSWFISDNWGIGLSTGLWLIPEFNYSDKLSGDNALAGVIPLTFSVTYRQ